MSLTFSVDQSASAKLCISIHSCRIDVLCGSNDLSELKLGLKTWILSCDGSAYHLSFLVKLWVGSCWFGRGSKPTVHEPLWSSFGFVTCTFGHKCATLKRILICCVIVEPAVRVLFLCPCHRLQFHTINWVKFFLNESFAKIVFVWLWFGRKTLLGRTNSGLFSFV